MEYARVDADPAAEQVRHVTIVPFVEGGSCVGIRAHRDDRLELPTGAVEPGEDWLLDTTLRIGLMTAGYFRQRIHPVGVVPEDDGPEDAGPEDDGGVRLYVFADGAPYRGDRPHLAVDLAEVTAEELAERVGDQMLGQVVRDAAEAFRTQSEESYRADNIRLLEPAYLRATTPEGGSGSGSSPERWRARREPIVDGIDRSGTFLDLGCANGHLMDCVHRWAAERGLHVEPYGVDLGPGLVELAKRRLPQWADRIWVGDALTWTRPAEVGRFDFVHLLADFVPPHRRRDLLDHALEELVAPGGRLLLSRYVAGGSDETSARDIATELGYDIAGGAGMTVWIDHP